MCRLTESSLSEVDQEARESDHANRSLFVQELLLTLLSDNSEAVEPGAESAVVIAEEALPVKVEPPPPQLELAAAPSLAPGVELPRVAAASNVGVEKVPAAAAAASRTNRVPAAGPIPPMDGGSRIVPNQSSSASRSALVKRKPRTGKDSASAASTVNKRH